jgi:hypothetical protein
MNIQMRTIPPAAQRPPYTVGDWYEQDGIGQILVSEMGDEQYEFFVAAHELVQYWLCARWGITEESVRAFGAAWGQQSHARGAEAGDALEAPHHWAHVMASLVERFLAFVLRVDFREYDETLICMEERARCQDS